MTYFFLAIIIFCIGVFCFNPSGITAALVIVALVAYVIYFIGLLFKYERELEKELQKDIL